MIAFALHARTATRSDHRRWGRWTSRSTEGKKMSATGCADGLRECKLRGIDTFNSQRRRSREFELEAEM
jgi:hypothetical protein